jgi:hypothetical protein
MLFHNRVSYVSFTAIQSPLHYHEIINDFSFIKKMFKSVIHFAILSLSSFLLFVRPNAINRMSNLVIPNRQLLNRFIFPFHLCNSIVV